MIVGPIVVLTAEYNHRVPCMGGPTTLALYLCLITLLGETFDGDALDFVSVLKRL